MTSNPDGARPPARPKSYHIRRASGHVLGPFSASLIKQMIRSGKLTGEEGISQDREQWVPIVAQGEFADAFDEAGVSVPGAMPATSDDGGFFSNEARRTTGMATSDSGEQAFPGFWSADESGEEDIPAPALRLSEDTGDMDAVGDALEPRPRTLLLGDGEESADDVPLPAPRTGLKRTSTIALTAVAPPGIPDLPARAGGGTMSSQGHGRTQNLPGSLLDDEGADLPVPRSTTDLPRAAGTSASQDPFDLPASVDDADLPVSLGGEDLPAPMSPPLPGRRDTRDATGGARTGDMAGSGAPFDTGTAPAQRNTEDALSEFDSFFGTDDPTSSPVAARTTALQVGADGPPSPTGELRGGGGTGDLGVEDDGLLEDLEVLEADDFAPAGGGHAMTSQGGALGPELLAGAAPTPKPTIDGEDEFAEFFSDAPASAGPPQAGGAKASAAAGARKKGASTRVIGAAAVLLVLIIIVVAIQLVQQTMESRRAEQQSEVVTAPVVAPRAELGPLDALRDGSYSTLTGYIETGRSAIDGGDPDVRARLLVAGAWAMVEYPEMDDLGGLIDAQFEALRAADSSPNVQLARGAWLAANADPDALTVLGLLRDGELAAWAELFRGFYAVQVLRGVVPPVEVEDAEEPEEDQSDEQEGAPADERDEVAEEVEGDEPEGGAREGGAGERPAVHAPVLVELSPEERLELLTRAERAFASSARADSAWVTPLYWRARILSQKGEVEAAYRASEEALAVRPDHANSVLLSAAIDLRRGNSTVAEDKALALLESDDAGASARQRSEAFGVVADASTARFLREAAVDNLRNALQADPSNVDRLRQIDRLFEDGRSWAQALEFYRRAEDLGVPQTAVMEGQARALLGSTSFDEAERVVEQARRIDPESARLVYLEGRVAEARTRFELAAELYTQALQIDPELMEAELRLVDLERRGARRGDALARLERVSRNVSLSSDDLADIGERYLALDETNSAVARFNRAVELDRSNARAWLNLIEFYVEGRQYRRALDRIEQMRSAGVEHPILSFARARTLKGLEDYNSAIEAMRSLIGDLPDNADYMLELGKIHVLAGNYDAARETLVAARDLAPARSEIHFWIARTDIATGRFSDAISQLNNIEARGSSGELRYWLGYALEQSGQFTPALSEYSRAIDSDAAWSLTNPEVFFRRGKVFFDRGIVDAAYQDMRTVLTLRPEHTGANSALGRVYFVQRQWEDAIASFNRSLAVDGEQPDVHFYAGLAWLNRPNPNNQRALEHLETARDSHFGLERPELHQRLGFVYRDLNRQQQAVAELERYLELAELPYQQRRTTENEIRRLGGRP